MCSFWTSRVNLHQDTYTFPVSVSLYFTIEFQIVLNSRVVFICCINPKRTFWLIYFLSLVKWVFFLVIHVFIFLLVTSRCTVVTIHKLLQSFVYTRLHCCTPFGVLSQILFSNPTICSSILDSRHETSLSVLQIKGITNICCLNQNVDTPYHLSGRLI